jgi:hypothetical protein
LSREKRIGDEIIELDGVAKGDCDYMSGRQSSRCGGTDAILGADVCWRHYGGYIGVLTGPRSLAATNPEAPPGSGYLFFAALCNSAV